MDRFALLGLLLIAFMLAMFLPSGAEPQEPKPNTIKREDIPIGAVKVTARTELPSSLSLKPQVMSSKGAGVLISSDPPIVATCYLLYKSANELWEADGFPAYPWKIDEKRKLAFFLVPGLLKESAVELYTEYHGNQEVFLMASNLQKFEGYLIGREETEFGTSLYTDMQIPVNTPAGGAGLFTRDGKGMLGLFVANSTFQVRDKAGNVRNYAGARYVVSKDILLSLEEKSGWKAKCSRCHKRLDTVKGILRDTGAFGADMYMHEACKDKPVKRTLADKLFGSRYYI